MQPELVKKIVGLIPPFRLAKDRGQRVHRERMEGVGSRFWVEHPACEHERLYLTPTEFVEQGKTTGFFAGNAFDYLALHTGDLRLAVREFFERYRDRISNVSQYEEEMVLEHLQKRAGRARRGFDWLVELRENYQTPERFFALNSWLRENSIAVERVQNWCYFASNAQCRKFLQELYGTSEGNWAFDPEDENFLVIPFYNTWSNLSHLSFYQPRESREYQVALNPARTAWAGLHGSTHFRPARTVMFFDSMREALCMQSFYRDRLDDCLCLYGSVQTDFVDAHTIQFERGLALIGPDSSMVRVTGEQKICDSFEVQRFENYEARGDRLGWVDFLAGELLTIRREDGAYSPRVEALLSAVAAGVELRTQLDQALRALNADEDLLRAVQSWTAGDTFRSGTTTVEETRHGYLASHANRMDQVLLSNFTVAVDRNVMVANTGRVVMCGTARMNDLAFPFQLDRRDSTTVRGIEEAVLKAFNRWTAGGGRLAGDQRVPVITDPTQARPVIGILGQKCAAAPYREGWDRLGWVAPNAFVAPYWTRHELELSEGLSNTVLDDFQFSDNYRFRAFPRQGAAAPLDLSMVSDSVRAVMNTLVAWLVRGSFDYSVRAMAVQDTAAARNLLKAVCSVFGQVAPLMLNPSTRRNSAERLMPGLHRLPAYAHSNNPEALLGMDAPVWVLGEQGLAVEAGLAAEELHQITLITYHLINRVFDWMFTVGVESVVAYSVTDASQHSESQTILERTLAHLGEDRIVEAALSVRIAPEWQVTLGGAYDRILLRMMYFDIEGDRYALRRHRPDDAGADWPVGSRTLAGAAGEALLERDETYYWIASDFVEQQMHLARAEPIRLRTLPPTSTTEEPRESVKPQRAIK